MTDLLPLLESTPTGPFVSIELHPTDARQLSAMLEVLAGHGLAVDPDQSNDVAYRNGFRDGRADGVKWADEHPAAPDVRVMVGDQEIPAEVKVEGIAEAGTYDPAPPKESDGEVLARMGTDAAKWTDEFMSRLSTVVPPDWGTMVGWFANAIEAGKSAGRSGWQDRNPGQVEKLTAELAGARDKATGEHARAETLARDLLVTATQRDDLRNQRAGWIAQHDALRAELDRLRAARDRIRDAACAERDALDDELAEARNAAVNLEKSVDLARKERDDYRAKYAEADARAEGNRQEAVEQRRRANRVEVERDEARKIAEQFADRTANPFDTRALPWRGAKPAADVNPCIAGTCAHDNRLDPAAVSIEHHQNRATITAPMVHPS